MALDPQRVVFVLGIDLAGSKDDGRNWGRCDVKLLLKVVEKGVDGGAQKLASVFSSINFLT
jgi:hypothetical protein